MSGLIPNRGKYSFARRIMIAVLAIMILVTVSLSAVFLYYFFIKTYDLTIDNVEVNVGRLGDNITHFLEDKAALLENLGLSITILFREGPVPPEVLIDHFLRVRSDIPDVYTFYYHNNTRWNEPGGYSVFDNDWIPPDTWDNTQRPWFLAAKTAAGDVAFSEPYVDAETDEIVISLSQNIYDIHGEDIGVLAADIFITMLGELLDRNLLYPEQRLFLVYDDGEYINQPDPQMASSGNFFTDYGLEQYLARILETDTFQTRQADFYFYSQRIPGIDWNIVSITPMSVITSEIYSILFRLIIVAVAVMVISGGIVFFAMVRSLLLVLSTEK